MQSYNINLRRKNKRKLSLLPSSSTKKIYNQSHLELTFFSCNLT